MAPSETFVVLSGALWIPLIYFVQHKLVVALKYASLSTSEYTRFMSCEDSSITDIYRDQMQLIAAWLNRDEAVLEFEIGAAAIRVGSKLSDIFFSLPNPQKSTSSRSQHSYWHAFLRGREFVDFSIADTDGLEKTADGRYRVSVFNVITALASHDDVNYVWVMVFYTSSTFINMTCGPVVYNVLYVSIFDVLRQLQMVDELTAMIRISDLTLQPEDNGPDFELATISERMTMSTTGGNSTAPSSAEASLSLSPSSPLRSPTVSRDSTMSFSIARPSIAQIRGDRNMEAIYKINRTQSVAGTARPSTAYLRDLSSMHHLHRRSVGRSTSSAMHCPLSGTPQERDSRVSDVERASTASAAMLRASTASFCSTTMDPTSGALHRYTEIGERLAEDGGRAEIPRVSFDDVDNVLAWTFARLALQNFGDRFRFRIDIYVGGTIAIMVVLIVISLAVVFSYNNRFEALRSSFVLQSLVTVNLIYLFLMAFTFLSGLMNEKYKDQKQLLTRHSLRQRRRWLQASQAMEDRSHKLSQQYRDKQVTTMSSEAYVEGDSLWQRYHAEVTQTREVLEQLESFIGILDAENEWKPYTVFGIEASTSLTMTVMTSYASFIGLVLMLFSNYTYIGSELMSA
eukprot:gene7799-5610_t